MKTLFSKRRFLAALTAALLISAALVASCMNQLEEQADSKIVIPEGKGLVIISVSDNARTIMPSAALPATNNLFYTATFTSATIGGGGTTNIHTGTTAVGIGNLNGVAVPLAPATDWKVVITAWEGADTTSANPIAGYTETGITVNSSGSTPVIANLTAFLDTTAAGAGRNGTFTYDITLPALPASPFFTVTTAPLGYSTKTLVIRDHTGAIVQNEADGTPPSIPDTPIGTSGVIDLVTGSGNTGSLKLTPGYYRVTVTLSAANCLNRVVEEVLHIYSGRTSGWPAFTPAVLSQNSFSVAFSIGSETADITCPPLTMQPNIANAGTVTDPGDPVVVSGKEFDSWWDETVPVKWVFATSKVFSDKTLTARWKAGAGATITVTFDVGNANIAMAHNLNSGKATYGDIIDGDGTYYLKYTFSNAGGGAVNPATIVWKMDGVQIASGSAILTIDDSFAHPELFTLGNHNISVSGKLLSNGITEISSSGNLVITE